MMWRREFFMHVATGGNTSNLFDMKPDGFNLLGYLVPFVALGAGAVALTVVLRRMVRRHTRADVAPPPDPVPATDAELARLQAAIRKDD